MGMGRVGEIYLVVVLRREAKQRYCPRYVPWPLVPSYLPYVRALPPAMLTGADCREQGSGRDSRARQGRDVLCSVQRYSLSYRGAWVGEGGFCWWVWAWVWA